MGHPLKHNAVTPLDTRRQTYLDARRDDAPIRNTIERCGHFRATRFKKIV